MGLSFGRNYKFDFGLGMYWLFESSDDYFGAFHDTSWHFVRLNGDRTQSYF